MSGRQSKFLMWINYRIRVTIQDSRVLIGTFLAFDKHMNLVLADTEEYSRYKKNDKERKRSLGLVLLRGDNIISLSAESPPSQNAKRFSDVTHTGIGSSQPIGRGEPILSQSQPGIGSIGRGVGIPSMPMIPINSAEVNNGVRPPMVAPPNIKPPMGAPSTLDK